jgi:anti-sigma B factor antagonist
MPAKADIDVTRAGNIIVAKVMGEVDLTNAPDVLELLLGSVSNDCAGLVVDLSNARYLDSTGVGVFFDAVRSLHGRGQQVAVVCPPDVSLRRLLSITGIESVVPIADALSDAINAMEVARR